MRSVPLEAVGLSRHNIMSIISRMQRLWAYLTSRDTLGSDFVTSTPGPRNAVAIFRGDWISQLPETVSEPEPGALPLFADPRVAWGLDALGGVEGRTVLELGSLEAGHSYMLQHRGARSILGIEANPRFFLKCLVVKEVLELDRARFLCGDFLKFLEETTSTFDLCLASGVLYHMRDPVDLIARLGRVTDRVYIWTQYYDPDRLARNPRCHGRFRGAVPAVRAGFSHTLHRFEYRTSRLFPAFMGGERAWSHWLTRTDILDACRHVGFDLIETAFEEPDHPNGPCLALVASRSEPRYPSHATFTTDCEHRPADRRQGSSSGSVPPMGSVEGRLLLGGRPTDPQTPVAPALDVG